GRGARPARAWCAAPATATSAPSSASVSRRSAAARCATRTTSARRGSWTIWSGWPRATARASRRARCFATRRRAAAGSTRESRVLSATPRRSCSVPASCGSASTRMCSAWSAATVWRGAWPRASWRAKRWTTPWRPSGPWTPPGSPRRSTFWARRCGAAPRALYLEALERIAPLGARANVSLKLTQMGLAFDEAFCLANVRAIAARARAAGSFVRIDMEQSAYTERTLQLFKRVLYPEFGDGVGVVLQAYLRRTADDVAQMIALGARVRLCKGAYQEPASVAFPSKRDVDANYVRCMEQLLLRGNAPAIATHDVRIIEHAKAFARDRGIPPERFEFQLLYGVRRDLQQALRRQGYRVRVYVPFGAEWYPYLMRRLAERPANVAFLLGNLVREWLGRR